MTGKETPTTADENFKLLPQKTGWRMRWIPVIPPASRPFALINAYIENMNEFFTFWRVAPDQPFPWEAPKND